MIFDSVILCYFDKFNSNGMYATTTKRMSYSLFMCFRIFNFGQIKMIVHGDENLKKKIYSKC